jgi:Fic family protein
MSDILNTHPWLTFTLDLREVKHDLWLILGKIQAKIEQIRGALMSPNLASEFRRIALVKGALATTAIEGNTLTQEEVEQRIKGALTLPPSKAYLGQEIDNVVEAYNQIGNELLSHPASPLTLERLNAYNALVLRGLTLGEDVVPGTLRQHRVGVGRYQCPNPQDLPELVERFCAWMNQPFGAQNPTWRTAFGVLQAVIAHVYFAWIHPYGDGNGRTARLIEFRIALSAGVPDTAAHLLSNFYNQTRSNYYLYLQRASEEHDRGGLMGFVTYSLQGFVDALDEQIKSIEGSQIRAQWRDYLYEQFAAYPGKTSERRHRLMIDLSDAYVRDGFKPIAPKHIPLLSPRLAELYADRTQRTLQRDLSALEQDRMLLKHPDGYAPNIDILRGKEPPPEKP